MIVTTFEAVIEVFPKLACLNEFLQRSVGCSDNANVDADAFPYCRALHFALFQYTQKARLHVGAGLADFVKEYRATICRLEEPDVSLMTRR